MEDGLGGFREFGFLVAGASSDFYSWQEMTVEEPVFRRNTWVKKLTNLKW